ncbi:MAG: hypothetical protein ACKVHU_06275 [Acidimicrobiales bacterium]
MTGENCAWVRTDVIGDSEGDTKRLFVALEGSTTVHDDALAERSGDAIRLTACG